MEWPEPWSRLAACGWTTARLGTLDDLPKRGLQGPGEGVGPGGHGGGAGGVPREGQGVREHRQDPVGSGRPFRWPGLGGSWLQTGQDLPVGSGGGGRGSRGATKGKAPLARWPCRLSRLVGRAGDSMDLRDRAERSERTRWTVMLKRIIVESELPASEGWNADPDGTAWHRIGKGRRSTTASTSRPGGMWLHGCTAPTMCLGRGPLSSSSSTSCIGWPSRAARASPQV